MKPSAIRNLPTFYTPSLVVIPQISSHSETLLSKIVPGYFSMHQAIFNPSKVIVINQNESSLSIEEVRKMVNTLSFGSLNGELQAVLLLHVELASIPAQNALLKILEEPPPHIKFFLTTTATDAVLETIVSRCEVQAAQNDIQTDVIDTERYENGRELCEKICTNSVRENIELAETYQNKQEAIKILTTILNILHMNVRQGIPDNFQGQNLLHYTTAARTVLAALDSVQKNVNLKLVMAECFLKLQRTL